MSNASKFDGTISQFDGDQLYFVKAKVEGGRTGHGETEGDDTLKVDLRLPKSMGGNGGGNNPEQLFAVGYAACFEGAVRFVAGNQKVKTDGVGVDSEVQLGKRKDGKGFAIRAKLDVHLPTLKDDPAKAKAIVLEAHNDVCPYSHATHGNIDVEITVNGAKVYPA